MSLAVFAVRRMIPGQRLLDRIRRGQGPGRAAPHRAGAGLRAALDTSGTLAGYLRNFEALDPAGLLLVQPVTGPDGRRRYVVQLAGATGTGYARAVVEALRQCVPSGAELALIGHGRGARTAVLLAAARNFTAVYTVTDVITADPSVPEDGADEALAAYQGRPATPRLFTLHPR